MIDAVLLRRAVELGVITPAQSHALDRLDRELPSAAAPHDDERLRFITGFADVFVTIGLLLFLGAARYVGSEWAGELGGNFLVAALAWGLAEFFVRRRRMALPGIVLLACFALAVFCTASLAFGDAVRAKGWAGAFLGLPGLDEGRPLLVAAASLATAGLVALHYRRFRVPITVAAGAAALAGTGLATALAAAPDFARDRLQALLVVAGVAIFALAMRFDLADPARLTRRADIAFWLHLLAAPLIVHPVLETVTALQGDTASGAAILVLAVVLVLALVALVTDRRAILVSGLTYAAVAFGTLIRDAGFADRSLPLSLLALGAFILLLSAGWHPLRTVILRALPRGLAARLPHPIGA